MISGLLFFLGGLIVGALVAFLLTRSGKRTALKAIDITSKTVYPNGPRCGGEGNQARATISGDGLH